MRFTGCKLLELSWLFPMAAALLAGCGEQPQDIDAPPLPFDTRPAAPNEVPYAEGVGGTLGHKDSCLFVTSPGGGWRDRSGDA